MKTKDIGQPYLYNPTLNDIELPMPSTEALSPYSVGNMIQTPSGMIRTQRQFTGEIVSMTWVKLSEEDRDLLKTTIDSVGFVPVTLSLTDGGTMLTVIPESFTAYAEEKFEHYLAHKVRWNVSMTWKEVP